MKVFNSIFCVNSNKTSNILKLIMFYFYKSYFLQESTTYILMNVNLHLPKATHIPINRAPDYTCAWRNWDGVHPPEPLHMPLGMLLYI